MFFVSPKFDSTTFVCMRNLIHHIAFASIWIAVVILERVNCLETLIFAHGAIIPCRALRNSMSVRKLCN